MTREDAIKILETAKGSYLGAIVEALEIAIKDMEYRAEVDKYGSELNMMLAHKKQYDAERNKPDPEWEELLEYVKKLKEEKNG